MMNKIEIVSFDENVEELVDVCFQGKILTCYAQYTTHILKKNSFWNVEFYGEIFHEISLMEEKQERLSGLYRLGNSFSYDAVGILCDGKLDCGGIVFEEEFFLSDFYYLNNKCVCWKIERLEVEFVKGFDH